MAAAERPTVVPHEEHAGDVTVVVTTSALASCPATTVVEETLASLRRHCAGAAGWRVVLVADGYKPAAPGAASRFRCGVVAEEDARRYERYRARLRHMCAGGSGSALAGAAFVPLAFHHGFGHALRRGIERVRTRFTLVLQHDRTFRRDIPVARLLRAMREDGRLKYVGLPTSTTEPAHYAKYARSKYGLDVAQHAVLSPCGELRFVPLVQWYDSTHLVQTAHYRALLYGRDRVVNLRRSGFVEDKLGAHQLADIRANGLGAAHASYGTYVLDDGGGATMVGHLDGHDTRVADPANPRLRFVAEHVTEEAWAAVEPLPAAELVDTWSDYSDDLAPAQHDEADGGERGREAASGA